MSQKHISHHPVSVPYQPMAYKHVTSAQKC